MAVDQDIIIAIDDTNANVDSASGWDRCDGGSGRADLDGLYIRGCAASSDPDGTQKGAANHTHTIADHTHTWANHTHTVSYGGAAVGSYYCNFGRGKAASRTHTHANATSNNPSSNTPGNATGLSTPASTDNHPPYYEIIFAQSAGTHDIPSNGIVWQDTDSFETGWSRFQGDKYLKSSAADGDAGGTGGNLTHTHAAGNSHNHSLNHSHAQKNSGKAYGSVNTGSIGNDLTTLYHTHPVTLTTNTYDSANSNTPVTDATNHEPPYYKLNAAKNTSGGSKELFDGAIVLWAKTEASIPSDYARLAAMDTNFLKNCNGDGEVGNTGGGLQHSHTDSTGHTHTQSHTHTDSVGAPSATYGANAGTGPLRAARYNHTHNMDVTTDTTALQSATLTINNCTSGDALPQHKELIFIKYTAPAVGIRLLAMTGVGT